MSPYENRTVVVASMIVGICLLIGLAAGGYFIGQGGSHFKSATRTVTIRGLVEKEVKADQAVWILRFRRASDELRDANAKISSDREAGIAFLKNHGFKDEEIVRQPTRTIDKLAREFGQAQGTERLRYVVMSSLLVTTTNIELVTRTVGATEELLKAGVPLDGQREREEEAANPRYLVSTLNTLRPQLLAEATKNARTTVQQFASDSGAQVGRIRFANQGGIQIFGTDGNDETDPYSQTSTPSKKIRVVNTFEFELI